MARHGDAAGTGRARRRAKAQRLRPVPDSAAPDTLESLSLRLKSELLGSETTDEMERRGKTVLVVLKAQQALQEMARIEQDLEGEDGPMDAADEQALRDRLLARLDGFVIGLEQKGADRCPACGRIEPDRQRLERVGTHLAEAE